jgi:RimJ/RimL family protein N-acetyltransferase
MTTEITIRQFQPADVDRVSELWARTLPSAQPWNEPRTVICRKLSTNDGLFFVGERDGRIVAAVMAGNDGVRGWIYALAVAGDQRRHGVGRRILQEAENALRARGCDKINLQVRGDNVEVIEFYRRCGFTVEDRASLGKPLIVGNHVIAEPVPTIHVNDDVALSQITWIDKQAYLKHLNESDVFHTNMGLMPFPYTELDADLWISKVARETLEATRRRNWAIRNRDGELIGGTGVFRIADGEKAEIGYWLARPYWGRGIATDVVRRLCLFAFERYRLQRIFAHVFAGNSASARVLEKAGFEREGTLRSHHFRNGVGCDVWDYGLMRPR